MSRSERVALLDRDDPLSLSRQCRLLDVSRMAAYRPVERAVSRDDLDLMRRMDVLHAESPAMGARQFIRQLRLQGIAAGRNRVRRLMRIMGIRHVAPPPKTSVAAPGHKVHPYLLGGLDITEPNHAWCSDITYIPVRGGFLYLVAVMDWATRFVLSWRLSNSMGVGFCLDALHDALSGGATPRIFNTDQGSQFTSNAFTGAVLASGARMSMDGRGRCLDNAVIERLWGSLKREAVHLRELTDGLEAMRVIGLWMTRYNDRRGHSALAGLTPRMAYEGIPMPPLKAAHETVDTATEMDYGQPCQRAIPTTGVDLVQALSL